MPPDSLTVRAYRSVVAEHEKNVHRALRDIRSRLAGVGDGTSDPSMALGEATRLAASVNELITYLSALKALQEVSFLTGEGEGKH